VAAAVSGPVLRVPLMANAPLHPVPEAVQAVAFVELQVSVDAPPLATVVGFAASVAVGAGGGAIDVTLTVTGLAVPVPPGPLHDRENVVAAAVSALVICVPLVANVPVQPPEAVQPVAFVELQVNVEVPPLATLVGVAASVTDGAGELTVTVTEAAELVPPEPVQDRV